MINYTIFGESHGPAIGVVMTGLPGGLELNMEAVAAEMARRAPGKDKTSTARKEADKVQILSGMFEGKTTGTPLCAVIPNTDTRSKDYSKLKDLPRPGHADYTASVRYGGFADYRGGGHFSGRLTAPLVFAGAVAKQILMERGIDVTSRIDLLGGVANPTAEQIDEIILAAKADSDSVGGAVQCIVSGVPAGFGFANMRGSEANDPF
ncbi:MAG: chorismate synthase, partial [Oscillospiraceae bacterium]|nr:chorismate synthase [Oscillospiraceae bacterium]